MKRNHEGSVVERTIDEERTRTNTLTGRTIHEDDHRKDRWVSPLVRGLSFVARERLRKVETVTATEDGSGSSLDHAREIRHYLG